MHIYVKCILYSILYTLFTVLSTVQCTYTTDYSVLCTLYMNIESNRALINPLTAVGRGPFWGKCVSKTSASPAKWQILWQMGSKTSLV